LRQLGHPFAFFEKGWIAAIPCLERVSAVLVWIGNSCPMLLIFVFAFAQDF